MCMRTKRAGMFIFATALLCAAAALTYADVARTRVEDGVVVDATGRPVPDQRAAKLPTAQGRQVLDIQGSIDFDDVSPCGAMDTNPLRKTYKDYKVTFKGPSDSDGGIIVDECSNFSVSGYSPPNFLGFNCNAEMENGGLARGPETVIFSTTVRTVCLKIGSNSSAGQQIKIQAKNVDGRTVAEQTATLASAMQSVCLAPSKVIKKVIIGEPDNTPCIFIVDDITYSP